MGFNSAAAVLQLPVRLRGIQLGIPIDLLLDLESWHVLGFVVRCGDESQRFLPFAACEVAEGEIQVGSALMLLEDTDFYEERGVSFRSLLGGEVEGGLLRDLGLGPGGAVATLRVERDGALVTIDAAGTAVVPTRQAA